MRSLRANSTAGGFARSHLWADKIAPTSTLSDPVSLCEVKRSDCHIPAATWISGRLSRALARGTNTPS